MLPNKIKFIYITKGVRLKKKSATDCLDKYKCDMMKKGCGKCRELGEQDRGRVTEGYV